MQLSRDTVCQKLEVWAPRWHDRKALIADFKIGTHNAITFPKAKSLPGEYYLSFEQAKQYPTMDMKTKNGKTVRMRVVPLDDLQPLERAS